MSKRRSDSRSERVSLDQLFDEWAESAPEHPRRRLPWLRDGLLAAAVAVVIYATMRALGFTMPFVVLFGAAAAVLLVRQALAAVPVDDPPAALHSPAWGVGDDTGPRLTPVDGVVRVVQRWEARFTWTERDTQRYATAVQPRLVELVAERLRQRHGVGLRADPDRARALLGDPLWTFVRTPVTRRPDPREMAVIVAEMEKI